MPDEFGLLSDSDFKAAQEAVADMGQRLMLWLKHCLPISQEEFAKRLGVTRTTFTRWKKGQSTPREKIFKRIADFVESETRRYIREWNRENSKSFCGRLTGFDLRQARSIGRAVGETRSQLRSRKQLNLFGQFWRHPGLVKEYCWLIRLLLEKDVLYRRGYALEGRGPEDSYTPGYYTPEGMFQGIALRAGL